MGLLYSDLHRHRHLISRTFYRTPGSVAVVAPAKAAFVRVSLVAAGGWGGSGLMPNGISSSQCFGGGSSFARTKTSCAPADAFTLQIGDIAHTSGAGDALGDSIFTKNAGSVVLAKAKRGTSTSAGLASASVGDTKRDGSMAPVTSGATVAFEYGGISAGDDADTFPLGFGGRGSSKFLSAAAAAPGGGGVSNLLVYVVFGSPGYSVTKTYPPGNGRACVEFFDEDPAVIWPGY